MNDLVSLTKHELNGLILIVEDDLSVLHYMQAIIEREQLKYIVTNSGAEAMMKISAIDNNIKAVILDVVLPDMSGIGVAREIHNKYSDMPILFTTNVEDPQTNNLLWQHGMVYRKPIEEDFPAAVRRLILCANLYSRRESDKEPSNITHGRREDDVKV